MAVTTLLLLLLFATARAMAMTEDEANFVSPDDTMPEDEDQKMASMSHARGGLNDALRELPSLNTAGTDNANSAGREASLGAIPAVEPHPEFQEFIHKHKKSGHNYCPTSRSARRASRCSEGARVSQQPHQHLLFS